MWMLPHKSCVQSSRQYRAPAIEDIFLCLLLCGAYTFCFWALWIYLEVCR